MIDKNNLLPRVRYEERLEPFVGTNLIKVITGQRRVGKSCFLRSLATRLGARRPGVPILYVDKEAATWGTAWS